jgi:hypothetical protein
MKGKKMFGKKKPSNNGETFNLVNLVIGIARELKLNPIKVVKQAINFNANTKFINQMNSQIELELNPKSKKKSSK